MNNAIYTVYHLSIDPADYDAFAALAEQIVAATSAEADATIYEYYANADRTQVHIIERYRTSGLLPHIEQTFSPFAEQFLTLAKIEQTFVYGATTPEIRQVLDGFGARYFTSLAGFAR